MLARQQDDFAPEWERPLESPGTDKVCHGGAAVASFLRRCLQGIPRTSHPIYGHIDSEVDLEVSVVVGFGAWLVFDRHRLRGAPLERGPDFINDVACDLGDVRVLS